MRLTRTHGQVVGPDDLAERTTPFLIRWRYDTPEAVERADDPKGIAEYKVYHANSWPEVRGMRDCAASGMPTA